MNTSDIKQIEHEGGKTTIMKSSQDSSNLKDVIKRIMVKSNLRQGEMLVYFS